MPQTNAEPTDGKYLFGFGEEAAATVHLLHATTSVNFKKICPDLEQHGSCTSAGAMFSSMHRALHGALLIKTGELPDKPKARDFCDAYELAPKVGRPRREVAAREEAEKIAAAEDAEIRRKLLTARERQRHVSAPVGLDAGCHVGGFTTRGNRVQPACAAAIVEVCTPATPGQCGII